MNTELGQIGGKVNKMKVENIDKMIETIRELHTPDPECPYCGEQLIMRCKCGKNKSCDCGYSSGVSSCDCNPPTTFSGTVMWSNAPNGAERSDRDN